MDTATRLREAHAEAQGRFHEMLIDHTYGDPEALATQAYIAAEHRVDAILKDAQWEAAKAALDAQQAADHDYHTYAAHFDPLCDSCTYTQGSLQQPVYR